MQQTQEVYTISPVTAADIPAVTQLINSAYKGEAGSKSWTSEGHLVEGERTTEAALLDLISRPGVTIFKCCDMQSVILGSVLLEKKETTLYLGMLSVLPGVQTAGIGSRLIQYSEAFAREHQYNTITITVIDKRKELIDWYRRKGFEPTGNEVPFSNKSSAARSSFSLMEMRKTLV
ncbi:GNAT family N-acetyltransferase [Chitinophaga filiformis]|uniref:Predicted N-acetyltransferase YhbS n=1 Tax=Chitinophaga filiformis TaxID=104663 RepID=A0A1G7MBC2_CHIFI|nr:GNAT family N-acetyltransferase [Chitinophaga filiformis]SDF58460.1 Predicted N-acetyltransferase YhbS [Chitinophaga filiformis]